MRLTSHHRFWVIMALVIADSLFFGLSDPERVASVGLIVGFCLFVVSLYQLLYALLTFASWYGLGPASAMRRRLAGTLTGLAASIVALQSTGELGTRDILVLVPLLVGVYLYSYVARTE